MERTSTSWIFSPQKADELVKGGLSIAHAAFRAAGDGFEGAFLDVDVFEFGDVREVFRDERGRDSPQIEALAARKDGREHLFRLGGGEHELHMRRRFLEGFQQGVEGRSGEHVDFVNDVDFKLGGGGGVFDGVAEIADLFDAVVAGAVDFQNVNGAAFGDLLAAGVVVGEIDAGAVGAIEAFGEDAGDGGLAGAARADEQKGVGDAALRDGVAERLRDVLLADDVREALRAILAGYDLVRHY